MFLDKIYNTSSFRHTVISSIVLCIALILLFYLARWSSDTGVAGEINKSVASETREVLNNANGKDLQGLAKVVTHLSTTAPRFFYVLQDAEGHRLAGNLPAVQPVLGIHDWRGQRMTSRGPVFRIHGSGVRTIDGAYLFVGLAAHHFAEDRRGLKDEFIWLTVFAILLIFVLGLVTSGRLLRRVDAMSHASREIISGDLDRRLPIRGTNDEFDRLATSINAMLDRLQALMNSLRQILADEAHDLRMPLARLRQNLEHARNKAVTVEDCHVALDQSMAQMDSILIVFSSLLRIAQIESCARRGGFKRLDLAPLLREVIELYRPVAEEKEQTLIAKIESDLSIEGDGELLKVLFVNILDNATKHAPPGCTIHAATITDEKHICVEIADNGPGIPEPCKAKVFQRFYRLEQSRTTPGHGLGLSFVAAVAGLHDATINLIDNAPGLRVRVTFARVAG